MEPNDGGGAGARAHELRATLGARRQLEALLAEAGAARQAAAADADAIVEEAQLLSDELLQESRAEAEVVLAKALAAADAIRARAEADVENHRQRVRTEVAEQVRRELEEANRLQLIAQHEQQQATIGDLEASVRILGVSLDSATANVGELLAALAELHSHSAESLSTLAPDQAPPAPPAPPAPTAKERAAERAARAQAAWEQAVQDQTSRDEPAREQTAGDELFRVTAPGTSVPSRRPVFDVTGEDDPDPDEAPEGGPPRSATEAFLLSSHIDHGDPPLPPMDDTEIGARYARDAMRATARSRSRQDDDPLGAPDDVEPDDPAARRSEPADGTKDRDRDTAGKPLGWLFRSS